MKINVNALKLRIAEWMKSEFLPKVFEGQAVRAFLSGTLSGAIVSKMIEPYEAYLETMEDLTAESLKKMVDDGFAVNKNAPLPFVIGPDLLPEQFRFLAPLFFDMSLPDPSIRGDFSREDIYKMIDYVFPATITKTVTL